MMTNINYLLEEAQKILNKKNQEKIVSNVERRENAFLVEFSGKHGEPLFIDQGVVIPANLGFQPEVGMTALYTTENGGAIGAAADLTFKNSNGDILFSAHRKRDIGLNQWSVTHNKQTETAPDISERIEKARDVMQNKEADTNGEKNLPNKYAFYYAQSDLLSDTFIRIDKESGKVDHAFSCSPFTGQFYKNMDEQYAGKTYEELLEDKTVDYLSRGVILKECTGSHFAKIENLGISKTHGREVRF